MSNQDSTIRFSKVRFAFLILLGNYPIITIGLYLIVRLTHGWALWQRTLLVTPLMVLIMVWFLIPWVHKRFAGFLNPPRKA